MKILFLVPYPLKESPSQRFRFEQYFQILEKKDYQWQVQSFFNSREWQLFYATGNAFEKVWALLKGLIKRVHALILATSCDFIFIHREATPIGPPIFEWLLANVLRKKIIYDFDDAIWLTDRENESWILKTLKWRKKVASICRWSYKVSCGNQYLTRFALNYNSNAVINPTTIDTENYHNKSLYLDVHKESDEVVIGWTGSHSTLKYLTVIAPVLQKLESQYPGISFIIIADQLPQLKLKRMKFITWKAETEIQDLLKIDIGIMPLPDDQWTQGKCGFKALQYMALEIPAVVSDVGVNTEIIADEDSGFLCATEDEWFKSIEKLIGDKQLRKKIGLQGRKRVVEYYSVLSNSSNFLSLFK